MILSNSLVNVTHFFLCGVVVSEFCVSMEVTAAFVETTDCETVNESMFEKKMCLSYRDRRSVRFQLQPPETKTIKTLKTVRKLLNGFYVLVNKSAVVTRRTQGRSTIQLALLHGRIPNNSGETPCFLSTAFQLTFLVGLVVVGFLYILSGPLLCFEKCEETGAYRLERVQ